MARVFDAIKKPYVWIFASVVYIWLLGLIKVFAALGPTYVISTIAHTKNSLWISDVGKAFIFYAQEVAKQLGYKYEYVLYSLLANVLILVPAMVIGFFVLRKKIWARNTIIALIFAYIVQIIAIGLLTSEPKFSVISILSLNTIILLATMYVLMRKSTKETFLCGRST